MRGLGEVAQSGIFLDLAPGARFVVHQHVIGEDLPSFDLRADLGQRKRAKIQSVLLHQPALDGVLGAARRRGRHRRTQTEKAGRRVVGAARLRLR